MTTEGVDHMMVDVVVVVVVVAAAATAIALVLLVVSLASMLTHTCMNNTQCSGHYKFISLLSAVV